MTRVGNQTYICTHTGQLIYVISGLGVINHHIVHQPSRHYHTSECRLHKHSLQMNSLTPAYVHLKFTYAALIWRLQNDSF